MTKLTVFTISWNIQFLFVCFKMHGLFANRSDKFVPLILFYMKIVCILFRRHCLVVLFSFQLLLLLLYILIWHYNEIEAANCTWLFYFVQFFSSIFTTNWMQIIVNASHTSFVWKKRKKNDQKWKSLKYFKWLNWPTQLPFIFLSFSLQFCNKQKVKHIFSLTL